MDRNNSILMMANMPQFVINNQANSTSSLTFPKSQPEIRNDILFPGAMIPKIEIDEETEKPTSSNMPINPLGSNSRQVSTSCYHIALDQCPTVKELYQYAQGLAESGVVMDETAYFDSEKPGAYINFFINVDEIYMSDVHRDILAPWTLTVDGKTLCKIRTENQTYLNLDGKTSTTVRYSFCSKHPRQAPVTKKIAVFPVGDPYVRPHSGFVIYKVEQPFNLCEYTSVKGLSRKRRNYMQNDHETAQFIDSYLKTEAAGKEEEQKKLGRCMGKLSKLEDKMSEVRKQAYMAVLSGDEDYLDFLMNQSELLLANQKSPMSSCT